MLALNVSLTSAVDETAGTGAETPDPEPDSD
jgi:hypothetical protein